MILAYYAINKEKIDENVFSYYINKLPNELKIKILKKKKWKDSQALLLGKYLLKKILFDLDLNFELSDLKYSSYGQPYLDESFSFSLSHSADYVVCVFSDEGRIGVDMEYVQQLDINYFESYFVEDEWRMIKKSTNWCYSFYEHWVSKEAISKAIGRGLNFPLKNITVSNNEGKANGITWHLKNMYLSDQYVLKIASDKNLPQFIALNLVEFITKSTVIHSDSSDNVVSNQAYINC